MDQDEDAVGGALRRPPPATRRCRLISLEANGVPRNYHRVEDSVAALDMGMVVRAADFGAAVAMAALAQGAILAAQTTAT